MNEGHSVKNPEPPPKVKEVMFSPLSVFVSVWIGMSLSGQVRCVTRTNWFGFGENPDPDPLTRILK